MLDKNVKYALALEGGGFRGAYQGGALAALNENGIKFSCICGTSIGALNGMMAASGQFKKLKELWQNFELEDLFNFKGQETQKLLKKSFDELSLFDLGKDLFDTVADGGLDITPLIELIKDVCEEDIIRSGDVDFGLTTLNLSDKKKLELMIKDMPNGSLPDFLLASSYLPVFKRIKLGGKDYLDGGFFNQLPTNMLLNAGYRDIIEIYLNSSKSYTDYTKQGRINKIKTKEDLGGILTYDKEKLDFNYRLGYYDAIRLIHGFEGEKYVIDAPGNEAYYISIFYSLGEGVLDKYKIDMTKFGSVERAALEDFVKRLASGLKTEKNYSYKTVYISLLEHLAEEFKINRFNVYLLRQLECLILERAGTKTKHHNKLSNLCLEVLTHRQNMYKEIIENAENIK